MREVDGLKSEEICELLNISANNLWVENFQQLFAKLTNPNGAIKVFCEVADLDS